MKIEHSGATVVQPVYSHVGYGSAMGVASTVTYPGPGPLALSAVCFAAWLVARRWALSYPVTSRARLVPGLLLLVALASILVCLRIEKHARVALDDTERLVKDVTGLAPFAVQVINGRR